MSLATGEAKSSMDLAGPILDHVVKARRQS